MTQGFVLPDGTMIAQPSTQLALEQAFGVSCQGSALPVHLCGTVTTTFDMAHSLSLTPWESALALAQEKGRGQIGRHWISPQGNIYSALVLPYEPCFRHDLAALLVGSMVAHALHEHKVMLKWPNDLVQWQDGTWRKIGGLLLEERNERIVMGLGINIASAPSDDNMRKEHAFAAGRLCMRESLWTFWTMLVHRLQGLFSELITQSTTQHVIFIEQVMAFIGQEVSICDPPLASVTGRMLGIDEQGTILLQCAEKVQALSAGSLHVSKT